MTSDENRYQPQEIEERWQKRWAAARLDTPDLLQAKRPFYNLMMFPYPSAEGLHVGNMYAFTGSDIYGRFKRMQGYDCFQPIGLDGFGIHSENYAFKVGKHPVEQAAASERRFYNQLHTIGAMYDWTRTVETYDPNYYRWTQWLFVQMFKHGLAYRGKAEVNWCPSCKTVLADEQVIDGACERCGNIVEKRLLEQWFFRITAYAEKLLQNSYSLDWSTKVKLAQRAWIGKKEGRKIQFTIHNSQFTSIEVFTTRPDTIYGATFVVLSPKHPLVGKVQTVVNPATKKEIPVFVDDYVIGEVGTGAIMGVPAYDARDRAFARRMKLPVARAKLTKKLFGEPVATYHLRDWLISRQRYWGPPIPMIFCKTCAKAGKSWFTTTEAKRLMPGPARHASQREAGGWYAVPEKDLPVRLPRIEDYKPGDDGVAPLAKHKEFYETTCPGCGAKAVRETDVSDTFLDSSWYFLRYPSLAIGHLALDIPWDSEVTRRWLPVHMYTGGAEHSVLHLLYSRFVTMALCDMGYIEFDEPFTRFYAHGLVIKDGAKMSKSKGNVVNPDEYISRYGADALRLYLMFTGPYDQGGDFRDSAMEGMHRWVGKVWRLALKSVDQHSHESSAMVKKALHRAIKKVGEDIERRRYNTAIAAMMELVNVVVANGGTMMVDDLKNFLKILAPFAPYMTEELWQRVHPSFWQASLRARPESGGDAGQASMTSLLEDTFTRSNSIHVQSWPAYDPKLLEEDTVEIIVQVNGKLRDTIRVKSQKAKVKSEIEKTARASEKVSRHLAGKRVKKVIFVPGRLINFVI